MKGREKRGKGKKDNEKGRKGRKEEQEKTNGKIGGKMGREE